MIPTSFHINRLYVLFNVASFKIRYKRIYINSLPALTGQSGSGV